MDPRSQPPAELGALERRLLEAARHDSVPEALRARMAEGLGLHVAATTPSAAVGAASKLGAPLFAKAGLWGALAVVVGVMGWRAAQPAERDAAAVSPGGPNPIASPSPIATPIPIPIPIPTTVPSASTTALDRPTVARPSARVDDSALRAEVALLDQARFALREDQGARALRLLDQHRQRFAQGILAPEAAALRIEALVQQGSYARAEALSQRFASAYPSHPLRERVSALGSQGASRASALPSRTP
jgi:hypothetical protein